MTGLLPDWVTEYVSAWSVPMIALGITTVICLWFVPRLRTRLSTIAPLVLGLVCLVVAVVAITRTDPVHLAFGAVGLTPHLLWQFPLGVAVTVGIGAASFLLERRLLSIRRTPRSTDPGMPPALQGLEIPSRGESMEGIADVATRPILFVLLTTITVVGEELLFRGVFLTHAFLDGGPPLVAVVLVQAVLYAMTHLAFGPATIASKAVLGVGLGVGAFTVGIAASLIGHSLYQYWVYQQFAPLRVRAARQE